MSPSPLSPSETVTNSERVLGDVRGAEGPTLVAMGAMHGNEIEGMTAIQSVFEDLNRLGIDLRGRFIGLAGNLRAQRRGVRFIDRDLNRFWRSEYRNNPEAADFSEFQEAQEIDQILEGVIAETEGPLSFIDLHSFSSEGEPFAISPGNDRDLVMLRNLPMPTIYGLDNLVVGTLANHLHGHGHRALGFEGGRHGESATVRNMIAFLWDELMLLGIIEEKQIPREVRTWWAALHARLRLPKAIRADYRYRIGALEKFKMVPGFKTFDYVNQGDHLAMNQEGPIRAQKSGWLLMPLYQGQGNDGYFIGHVEEHGLL